MTNPVNTDLESNLKRIKSALGPSSDLVFKRFRLENPEIKAAAVYMEGLIDKQLVHDLFFDSVASLTLDLNRRSGSLLQQMKHLDLSVNNVQSVLSMDDLILAVLSGDTVLIVDRFSEALSYETRGGEVRAVTEPSSQIVIRGPKEGFNECIGTNVALVRRRIRNPNLWLESMKIGSVTKTDVAVMYLNGTAKQEVIDEVRKRLRKINYDSILESGYIENLIEEESITPFPTMFNTERPDTIAAHILEGRVAIFVDGTPFVLVAPTTFFMFFQSAEDYYHRADVSSAIRFLRYVSLFISMFGPSIYIAAITFHQEMIPTPLLLSLASQRESVPFPALVEALIMEVSFEILREAGIRMPRAIGQAVSIVGALVLGQAAVQAGIVSSAMVIVVALTGISSFTTPAFNAALSIRLLRFAVMFFSAFLGFFGIVMFTILLTAHMCGLRSFGEPYLSPLAPMRKEELKDTFFRRSFKRMRPSFQPTSNRRPN
ncbi:spore germination protein KA [Paenibacillus sp. BK033]|uniref:spore germination protein n=1 Tax=Paenibacillus sp. BK033 TaxID=2512133 RepID=UPI0010539B93|nr:spore germination protein [Paenibacillus sp. BK033]TCM93079.1 spore germination protein KA [Paenibacillus sp. BK033]